MPTDTPRRYLLIRLPVLSPGQARRLSGLLLLLSLSNGLTHWLSQRQMPLTSPAEASLYLLDQAAQHLSDLPAFEQKVRTIAQALRVAPEWLMAVMYAESGFDPAVMNRQGSGAVGLIQFMPLTAGELHVSPAQLREMEPLAQLDYVEAYFQQVQQRYGPYRDLTDLYLAVLYPKARRQDPCYTLYARPALAYRQNAGLDENRDGKVTIDDIDRRLRRLFPLAYVATPQSSSSSLDVGR
jgi:hypothetical protein